MSLHNRAIQALVRSPAYVRVRRVVARLTRPLRQLLDLVAIVRCDLTRPIPAATARVPLETFVASREEVLGELTRLWQSTDPAEQERLARALFTRRLEAGFLCFVGRVEGRPVAYNWTQYEPGEDGGVYVDLRPHEVHCLDAYTIPELRGRNIHAALLREMLLFNAGLGYRCGYSKITVTNRQSPKAHRRLGWERTGTMLLAGRASGIRVVRLSGSTHPWRRLRPEDY
jgi:GNAT superfamily N-acetyltransferase